MTTLNPTLARPGTLADLIPGSGAVAIARDAGLVIGGRRSPGWPPRCRFHPFNFTPVPLTLQTFAVLLVGASLGGCGVLSSMLLYLAVPWSASRGSRRQRRTGDPVPSTP